MIDILSPALAEYGTPRQAVYLKAAIKHGSATKAAKALGVNPRTVQRSIGALKRAAIEAGAIDILPDTPSILFLDIETAPIAAYIWAMYQEVNTIDMIDSDWYILSFAAKWSGEDNILVRSQRMYNGYKPGSEVDKPLLKELAGLLNQADFVVTHNGDRFDLRKINIRMLQAGLRPCTPYRSIDTLKMAKRTFGATSNKLDWLAWILLKERKLKHEGFPLWRGVMQGNDESWDTMERYNARDVDLLERVYLKMRPWDHMHPNLNLATNNIEHACTSCGSSNLIVTGQVVTAGRNGAYVGYECKDCGNQMRGTTNIRTHAQAQATLVNA